jgi:outer membrane protein
MWFFLFISLLLLLVCNGCNYYMPNPCCPPPPSARRPNTLTYSCTNPTVPPVIPDGSTPLALADLIDIGLQNSPRTRAVWYQAKQAATDVGIARGAYLPYVDLQGFWLKEQFPQLNINQPFIFSEKIVGVILSTTYLIFDFGGRNSNVLAARAALDSLCWFYNWEVQTVMANIIQSYYDYVYAQAGLAADEKNVEDNLITMEAAAAGRSLGAAALLDELQAQTSLLQSQIMLEQGRQYLNIARATLAHALGLPPDTPICVAGLPETIATEGVCQDMARLLQATKEHRSDLKAQRSQVLQKRFNIRTAQSALMPNINVEALGGTESIDGTDFLHTFALQFNLNIPLFHSFADINVLRKTQAALCEAQANLDDQELAAFLAVLSDYYELVANQQILKYSYSYLDVAQENQRAEFASYTAGVTTIIDLMIANGALNVARKQLIDAKSNFLTSLANLTFHTGSLTTNDLSLGPALYPPWATQQEKTPNAK